MSIEKIFAEVFLLQESSIVDSLELREIPSWDSLSHMMLISRLEEVYKVQLTGEEIADMKSVSDARAALLSRGASF